MRIQLLIAVMCAAMLAYFVLLGRFAVAMIGSGRAAAVGLGLALLIMPVIGLWAMIATLRAGFAHQRLARLIADDGMELDTSALPRRPSGRIERDAADALFATVRTEVEDRSRRLAPLVPAGPGLRLRGGSAPRPRSHEDGPRIAGPRVS